MVNTRPPDLKVVTDGDKIIRKIYGRTLSAREMLLSQPSPVISPLIAEQRTSDIVVDHYESGALTPLEILLFVQQQKIKLLQIEGERFKFLQDGLIRGDENNYFKLTPEEQKRLDTQQGKFSNALDRLEDSADRAAAYIHPKMGAYDPNSDRQTKLLIEGGLPDLEVAEDDPISQAGKK